MRVAKPLGSNPREIATELADGSSRASTASPAPRWRAPASSTSDSTRRPPARSPRRSSTRVPRYGRTRHARRRRSINLEFVSANPTGPLHIGHTRWAALGDSIGRVLRAAGADVANEYYINDAGTQMDNFGLSVLAAAKGEPTPEGGYPGSYIADARGPGARARAEAASSSTTPSRCTPPPRSPTSCSSAEIRASLDRFNVHFDVWTSERRLQRDRRRRPVRRRHRRRAPARPGPRLRRGRRRVGAHDRLRRRQGPRHPPRQRRLHLLRGRRRLLPRQGRPRLRAQDLPARRRPPRLRAPPEGARRGGGRRPRDATSRC